MCSKCNGLGKLNHFVRHFGFQEVLKRLCWNLWVSKSLNKYLIWFIVSQNIDIDICNVSKSGYLAAKL